MHTEDDTADWLGIPTPLETCKQHILLLENEVAELNLQLRVARENIFKLVNMQAQTEKDRDEALARLREKAGEAARLRKQVSDLELSVRSKDLTNEDLRRQIPHEGRRKLSSEQPRTKPCAEDFHNTAASMTSS
nr:hypothetical protein FFPRI1PSEUD_44310 [Pseudomonas sp. FFPRI_1]